MDWELKSSPWDFTNDHDLCLPTLIGTNNLSPNNNRDEFSVDLKLGRLDNRRDDNMKLQKSPLKRARSVSGVQNVTCLVDGCTADLSECREYHRRHRVCEQHSKTPVVSVGCKEQRFCQQCSRFHSLTEFDGEKRSCRKRLDGHNRRRRKPQSEAFYINHRSFLSDPGGTRLLQFGGPETYTTSAVSTWPSIPKHPVPHHSATFPKSLPTIQDVVDKRFPFLLINDPERNNHHQRSGHSLLSSPSSSANQYLGPTALQFEYPTHQYSRLSTMVPQPSTYQNNYSGNEITMMSLSPDNLLEKGASQVLPFSWK